MTKQEFIKRVGEGYSDAYEDANLLYMALPNTDKDLFCALWALEKQTGFDIFGTLRKRVSEYEIEKISCAVFAECCRPLHECKLAHELESKIKDIAAAVITCGHSLTH